MGLRSGDGMSADRGGVSVRGFGERAELEEILRALRIKVPKFDVREVISTNFSGR